MDVTLIDSPLSNSANIARALRAAGAELRMTSDAAEIARARKLVLPGVGSFAAAMSWLKSHRIDAAIHEAVDRGAMLLGICVGHQLLFDVSFEMGVTPGLGLIRGEVRKFDGWLPVPQIGWNRIFRHPDAGRSKGPLRVSFSPPPRTRSRAQDDVLFFQIADGTPFYFVNSYAASNVESEIAHADYGARFTAAVRRDRVFGTQFHPEKSSSTGLQLLRNFVAWR